MLRRALPLPLRMRPRVQRAPGIPCALRSTEGQRMSQLGRQVSRECEVVCYWCHGRPGGCEATNHRRHSGTRHLARARKPKPRNCVWGTRWRPSCSTLTSVVMDSGLDASHRPGMTAEGLRVRRFAALPNDRVGSGAPQNDEAGRGASRNDSGGIPGSMLRIGQAQGAEWWQYRQDGQGETELT
jgi:hypothetical protein